MMANSSPENWLEMMRIMNPAMNGQEYGLHLQSWLESRESDDTGCYLVDEPLVMEYGTDDSI